MKATRIKIEGTAFLLPESHQSYEFPSYILKHKEAIKNHIEAGKKLVKDPLTDHFAGLQDLSEFKKVTGIIGFPFNQHDPSLYAQDRGIEILAELDL